MATYTSSKRIEDLKKELEGNIYFMDYNIALQVDIPNSLEIANTLWELIQELDSKDTGTKMIITSEDNFEDNVIFSPFLSLERTYEYFEALEHLPLLTIYYGFEVPYNHSILTLLNGRV